jgi:hypothetical protein
MAKKTSQNDFHLIDLVIKSILRFSIITLVVVPLAMVYFPYQESIDESISQVFQSYPEAPILKNQAIDINSQKPEFENGIHLATGLAQDANFKIVKAICTRCHSAKLITQNKATRQGWKDMITWMQATQGLEDLGDYEVKVLDYLSTHYAPKEEGRRPSLNPKEIEWYVLQLPSE